MNPMMTIKNHKRFPSGYSREVTIVATKQNSLTEGSIIKALFRLAIPIMGTSFVQMAYNMTDMIWVGRIEPEPLQQPGRPAFTPGCMAFVLIPKIGAEVGLPNQWASRT